MKLQGLLVAAVAASVTVLVHGAIRDDGKFPIPAFLWTPSENVLNGQNRYFGLGADGLGQSELVNLLDKLTGQESELHESLQSICADDSSRIDPVEAVVLILADELTTGEVSADANAFADKPDGGLFGFVKKAVEGSTGSAVLPFTFVDTPKGAQNAYSSWLFKHPSQDRVVIDMNKATSESIKSEVSKERIATASGPLPIIVSLNGNRKDLWNEQIENVLEAIHEATSGNYLAVFTGMNQKSADQLPAATHLVFMDLQERSLQSTNVTISSDRIRSNPNIIFAMIFFFVVLLSLIVYFYCIDTIQTPSRFLKKNPPLGKIHE